MAVINFVLHTFLRNFIGKSSVNDTRLGLLKLMNFHSGLGKNQPLENNNPIVQEPQNEIADVVIVFVQQNNFARLTAATAHFHHFSPKSSIDRGDKGTTMMNMDKNCCFSPAANC
ncbi:hypothetical protein R3W88_018483 [Solanum pinnatisectum]|uniref:Uncharacterized protein n=1 Tax=Solanum pinnatisectum TaxID=50273 RepID=A0AAV9L339_9SOLN|nr:hypothetical protein R3W88_018483 [Solanum pinnatisectum]